MADEDEIPEEIISDVVQLTRQARQAVDENERAAYLDARADLLAEHDFTARVREEDRAVLVLYPHEWVVDDGTVDPANVEDVDRGIERPLEGVKDNDWETIMDHNEDLADTVEQEYGETHGENVRELAAYMSNHYLKPIEEATATELKRFESEYYPRNTWMNSEQKAVLSESIRHAFEVADAPLPSAKR